MLWAEYFESATIIGLDVDLSHVLPAVKRSSRIRIVEGNATHTEFINQAVDTVDIVIDDGSHILDEQLSSFKALAPKVRPGGLYVIEDIWPFENALCLRRAIPGSEIIDRRHIKGRSDDVLLAYKVTS